MCPGFPLRHSQVNMLKLYQQTTPVFQRNRRGTLTQSCFIPTFTQVINAALTLAARPQSKVAQDNMDVFKDQWEKQVRILTEAVDDITSVDDFLSVSGEVKHLWSFSPMWLQLLSLLQSINYISSVIIKQYTHIQ